MKLKGLLLMLVFMFSFIAVQAQDKMFERFSNNKDITTVYISKALLSMVPNMAGADMGGVNVKSLANKLEQLEIYTSDSKKAFKEMLSEADAMKKNKAYETLMSVKDKDQVVNFYAQRDGNGKFKDLIMFVNEESECTVIRIVGNFTMEDLQKVVNSAND
ncbi:DUF4252 domain-containing protein [Dysgonomonas sp. 521]|uniref:DUF4252 domain-containing protein n=1 Tax=Dysgonomonas sp. 521 TaxID=2302932 RepID=UPI0013D5FC7E|nr:DUF4252 domain-containing protein [Dysgonomonas sp. 521]NDV93728.1 DUF4252 domain-containing protein [Dysgonomonas sp. 521]